MKKLLLTLFCLALSVSNFVFPIDVALSSTELTLCECIEAELDTTGAADYYQVYVESGKNLLVTLDDTASQYNNNELYIKYDALPSRTDYDDKFDLPSNPDQSVGITDTQAGYYYILVYADYLYSGGTPATYTICASDNSCLPTIPLGECVDDKLDRTQDADYYQVYVESGKNLLVTLDDTASQYNNNELYIKYDALPSRTDYDDTFDLPSNPDQSVGITDTQAGYYYILVYADYLYSGGTPATYTICAFISGDHTTTTVEPTTTTTVESTTTTSAPTTDITADFIGSPTFGFSPLTVNFTNLSSGDISGYEWNFGDGNTSSAESPNHTYTTMGNFGVILTAYGTDGSSKTETKPNYVFVLPGCPFATTLDNPEDINILRTLRDSMLNNVFGLIATCMYYQNSAEVAIVLAESSELQDRLRELVSENIGVAINLINGDKTSLAAHNVDEIIDFLNELKSKGSPNLKANINLVTEAIESRYFLQGLGVSVE